MELGLGLEDPIWCASMLGTKLGRKEFERLIGGSIKGRRYLLGEDFNQIILIWKCQLNRTKSYHGGNQ